MGRRKSLTPEDSRVPESEKLISIGSRGVTVEVLCPGSFPEVSASYKFKTGTVGLAIPEDYV